MYLGVNVEGLEAYEKTGKKRSLCLINEHYEPVFNAVAATQMVVL